LNLEHDTVISLIDLAKVSATSIASLGGVAIVALKVRAAQNRRLQVGLMKELDKRLTQLSQQVKHIENTLKITQDLVVVHADRIKEGNMLAAELKSKIGEIEERLPEVQDIMEKTFSFFVRSKAEKAEEVALEKSGGLIAVRPKGEK
jgi:hypothetical protein